MRCSLVLRNISPTIKMSQQRATCWSITINNPGTVDEENIAVARQRGWKVEGQIEEGASGTRHYQLAVSTPQVRFSAVKKAFPRAHIEPARNVAALKTYVQKEETRVGILSTEQERFPSQQKVWQWFGELEIDEQELSDEYRCYVRTCADREVSPQRAHDWKQEYMLERFDKMMAQKITEGYYCELIAVNPQIRSCVKKFGLAIAERHRRQTDRQTVEINIPTLSITNGEGSEERSEEGREEGSEA